MTRPFRTAIIGFGKIGAGYADDLVMAPYYPFATHAQVLAVHPAFAWGAAVDPSPEARALARGRWRVAHAVPNVSELLRVYEPEVAVLATPPDTRLALVEQMPHLRAVLVEKPLGSTLTEADAFLACCKARGILVQVNLWRRADETFRGLAAGGLNDLIGPPQAIFGVYGNGLINNGTHMLDFVRMLLGEAVAAQAMPGARATLAGPIPGDVDVPFMIRLSAGPMAALQPVRFAHYRENSLDIWGERGRLTMMQEGLSVTSFPQRPNRAMQGEREVASDQPQPLPSTVGRAFYRMYDNLAAALESGCSLWSPGESALQTARLIQAIVDSISQPCQK
jgi:predicted dehydrogenase